MRLWKRFQESRIKLCRDRIYERDSRVKISFSLCAPKIQNIDHEFTAINILRVEISWEGCQILSLPDHRRRVFLYLTNIKTSNAFRKIVSWIRNMSTLPWLLVLKYKISPRCRASSKPRCKCRARMMSQRLTVCWKKLKVAPLNKSARF